MVNSNVNALGVIFANTYDNLVPELRWRSAPWPPSPSADAIA